jgi:hypothetical protein
MPQENLIPPLSIPDLSKLNAYSEWAAVVRALAGGGSRDQTSHTLMTNAVRLLDASVRDYELGRAAITAFHARDPSQMAIGHILRATTHFESCIWHFERFIKHVKALRSLRTAEPELKALIPRDLSFLKHASEHAITELRHTLAHLEGAALRGELPQGAKIALLPVENGLQIADHSIQWHLLAEWLTDAHACVASLANFRPPKPPGA